MNDSPEAITFSWEITTVPVPVTGYKPTSIITIDSSKVVGAKLTELETLLYGAVGVDPALPTPAAVLAIFAGSLTEVTPSVPAYNGTTHTITIPTVTGVTYSIDGVPQAAGDVVIAVDTIVTAAPNVGYKFPLVVDDDWLYEY